MKESKYDWTLNIDKTALIVIDMQNDYCRDQGFLSSVLSIDISQAKEIISPLKKLLIEARSAGILIVYVVSERDPGKAEKTVHSIKPELLRTKWIGGPTRGTWGAEIVEDIEPNSGDHIVIKERTDGFYNTNLTETLEHLGVDTLIFTGVATNGCVDSTIRSAFCRDYDIILVKDCTASFDFGYGCDVFLAAIRNVEMHRGVVVSSSEIIKMLKEQR